MTSWRTRHSYLARKFGHFFLRTSRAERALAIVGALALDGLAVMQFVRVERQNTTIEEAHRGTDAYARPDCRHSPPRLPGLPYRADRLAMVQQCNSHALADGRGRECRAGAHELFQMGPISRR